eukprot:TRINITY_DN2709_c0_g3_i1.p1 TRINITY_DN2709_c0_g3~~TRINITY_DN2709_c0_g3_i1.p1  ORF type:complete len:263 (-),score=52.61 TRINITY_DN2709_c0_g3_i1:76-864(-)
MSKSVAVVRLQRELVAILKDPIENIIAKPSPKNILEWHYVIFGPKDSLYAGGVYHGIVRFSVDYPLKPPSILMITPNGRFQTNKRLCLSMSDYHPESWNPIWSVSSILNGLLSFMLETQPTLGSISTSDAEKRTLAKKSMEFNSKDPSFCSLFPHLLKPKNSFDSKMLQHEIIESEGNDDSGSKSNNRSNTSKTNANKDPTLAIQQPPTTQPQPQPQVNAKEGDAEIKKESQKSDMHKKLPTLFFGGVGIVLIGILVKFMFV